MAPRLTPLCSALGLALISATLPPVMAAEVNTLAPVQVEGKAPDYTTDTLQSGKFTQPLLDTPQSISVVPRQLIEEQQAQSLQDVLRNVPGITFTSGEGNLGWGDMFTIRGYSAEQSIMVDGIRDAGLASRNDTFNLERADAVKGAAGNYAEVVNTGIYVADTVTLTPQWLVQGALRYDRFSVKQVGGTAGARTTERSNDGAWSGRLGLTYKPVEYGSIYASYSQAAQPSAVGASTNNTIFGNTSSERFKPAVSKTYELGTKWDLLDQNLSVSGALFRTELSDSWDYGDDATAVRALPAKEVHGLELGVSGNITSRWSAFAGVSLMKSRITKGESKGAEAKNVPDVTFNLWTTYAATDKLSLSYGVQYVGKRRYTDNTYVGGLNNNSSTVDGADGKHPIYRKDNEKAPSYWVHSLAARYVFNENVTVGVNVDNLFNTFYYSRTGASLDGFQLYGVPGAGRTLTLTADLRF